MSDPHRHILAEAGRAFGAAFDPVAAPWNVVRFLVPRVADWAGVGLLDEHHLEMRWAAHAHIDGATSPPLGTTDMDLFALVPVPPDGAIGRVVRSGRPLIIPDVDLQRPDVLPLVVASSGMRAYLVLPLGRRRRPLGVLVLGAYEPARFGPAEVRLATALALRVGVVLDIAARCQTMRASIDNPIEAHMSPRRRRELSARARRRAELARQLIGDTG
jgi:GAF domain-containing protein